VKIGVNTLFVTPSRGGARVYLENVVRHLGRIDSENLYYLFVSPLSERLFKGVGRNVRKVLIPLRSDNRILRVFYEQVFIPWHVRTREIDVLFCAGNTAVFGAGCKVVLTVHSALAVRGVRQQYRPEGTRVLQGLYYDITLPLSVRRASRIVVVSEAMRSWLVGHLSVPRHKVVVVHEGVGLDLGRRTARTEVGDDETKRPYILFVSTLFPYKNADKLLQAFAHMKRRYDVPHDLVIVGRDPGGQINQLRARARGLGVIDSVRFTGPIPHSRLGGFYRNADVFVYPSSLESFGLPPLEAMACGTPVIGSDRGSVPEIIGDAGLVVDPDNIEALSESIYRMLNSRELRDHYVQKGYERVRMFTWERAARETLKVFEEVHESGGGYGKKR